MIRGKLAGTCLSNAFCGGVDLTRETERIERKVKIARITFGTLVAIRWTTRKSSVSVAQGNADFFA